MKKYLCFIFTLILSISAIAQNKSRSKRQFNGLIKIKYESLKHDKDIKNGIYQYFLAGHLLNEGVYQNNKKNGLWKYYCLDTSGVTFMGAYLKDVKVGKWLYSYHGKLLSEVDYDGYGKIIHYFVYSPKGDTIFNGIHPEPKNDSIVRKRISEFARDTILPSFSGGVTFLMTFLSESISWPNNISGHPNGGLVILTFIIGKDGFVKNVKIDHSLGAAFDDEAVRVVKSMPRWCPGMIGGLPAEMEYAVPLNFR